MCTLNNTGIRYFGIYEIVVGIKVILCRDGHYINYFVTSQYDYITSFTCIVGQLKSPVLLPFKIAEKVEVAT